MSVFGSMEPSRWMQLIDQYCERTDFTFWSEPANALSNVFLFLAGVIGLIVLTKKVNDPVQKNWLKFLSLNAMVIGIGSFLFHTLATFWSMLADVLPITVFMVVFLTWALRHLLQLSSLWVAICLLGFLSIGGLVESFVPKEFLNGSAGYLHALAALMIVGHLIRDTKKRVARGFIAAIAVFIFSLFFRSMDMQICASFPLGTHFLWHTLNGVLLLICLNIIVLNQADSNKS